MMISFILVKSLLEIRYSISRQIMNREIISTQELAFSNLLDVIPLMSNIDEEANPALVRIYERNSAVIQNTNPEQIIEHIEEQNFTE